MSLKLFLRFLVVFLNVATGFFSTKTAVARVGFLGSFVLCQGPVVPSDGYSYERTAIEGGLGL